MSHQRGGINAPRTFNKYPTAPDGRGASTVVRKSPAVGKDPYAVNEGKADTAAQMEHLQAIRERLAKS